jgi:hypothetical protein
MATRYPNAIDGYNEIRVARDNLDEIVASDHNDLRSAVIAMEQALGTNPQGIYGTLGQRSSTLEENFETHYQGTDLRHDDSQTDSNAKTSTFNSLTAGTLRNQISEFLELLDYSGSGATIFADGTPVAASSFPTAITNIVSQLGDVDGDTKIGVNAHSGSPHSLAGSDVRAQIAELLAFWNLLATTSGDTLVGVNSASWGSLTGTDLAGVLESVDGQIGSISYCTDGVSSSGGNYNGTDALESAIAATAGALADDYGSLILVRAGDYTISTNQTINGKVTILGIEDRINIVSGVGSGYMWTFASGSDGSTLSNLSIEAGASQELITFETSKHTMNNVACDGMILIDGGSYNKIQHCTFTGSASATTLINIAAGSTATLISHCSITHTTNSGVVAIVCGADRCVIEHTDISVKDENQVMTVTGDYLNVNNCYVNCQPFTADKPVVYVTGDDAKISNLDMINDNTGTIVTSFVRINGSRFKVNNLNINMSAGGSCPISTSENNNPLIFISDDGVVDQLSLRGGYIPTDVADGFTLNPQFPLIKLTGTYVADDSYGFVMLQNSHIKCPGEVAPSGEMSIVVIGDDGNGDQAANTDSGFFKLDNVTVDGYLTESLDVTADTKFMVANIPPKSVITNCTFIDGTWNACIKGYESHDLQIMNNKLRFLFFNSMERMIWLTGGNPSSVHRCSITGNSLQFNHLDNSANDGYAIIINPHVSGTNHGINNNTIVNVELSTTENGGINIGGVSESIAIGNLINYGNVGNTGIFPLVQRNNNVYQDGTGADLNVVVSG